MSTTSSSDSTIEKKRSVHDTHVHDARMEPLAQDNTDTRCFDPFVSCDEMLALQRTLPGRQLVSVIAMERSTNRTYRFVSNAVHLYREGELISTSYVSSACVARTPGVALSFQVDASDALTLPDQWSLLSVKEVDRTIAILDAPKAAPSSKPLVWNLTEAWANVLGEDGEQKSQPAKTFHAFLTNMNRHVVWSPRLDATYVWSGTVHGSLRGTPVDLSQSRYQRYSPQTWAMLRVCWATTDQRQQQDVMTVTRSKDRLTFRVEPILTFHASLETVARRTFVSECTAGWIQRDGRRYNAADAMALAKQLSRLLQSPTLQLMDMATTEITDDSRDECEYVPLRWVQALGGKPLSYYSKYGFVFTRRIDHRMAARLQEQAKQLTVWNVWVWTAHESDRRPGRSEFHPFAPTAKLDFPVLMRLSSNRPMTSLNEWRRQAPNEWNRWLIAWQRLLEDHQDPKWWRSFARGCAFSRWLYEVRDLDNDMVYRLDKDRPASRERRSRIRRQCVSQSLVSRSDDVSRDGIGHCKAEESKEQVGGRDGQSSL